jgi:hypothetical protein
MQAEGGEKQRQNERAKFALEAVHSVSPTSVSEVD